MKKSVVVMLVISMLSIISFASTSSAVETNYGSSAAQAKDQFTLEEMLTYAIQDEYYARAEYEKIMLIFGIQKPFSNIIVSEENHIAMLTPLFSKYGFTLPEDTAAYYVIIPNTLLDAYKAGVQAEIDNIAMYDLFLQQNLPSDVRDVFLKLQYASKNHLNAFQNKVAQYEGTTSGDGGGGYRYRGGN